MTYILLANTTYNLFHGNCVNVIKTRLIKMYNCTMYLHRPTDVHKTMTAINIDWVPIYT